MMSKRKTERCLNKYEISPIVCVVFRLLIHIFNLFLYFVKNAFTKVKSESGDVKTVYDFTRRA